MKEDAREKVDQDLETSEETKSAENETQEKAEGSSNTLGVEESYKEQIAQLNDKHLRLFSEFENFRRRTAKEKIDLIGTASADMVTKFLPVLDDFERAIEANKNSEDIEAVKKGFDLLYQKMASILQNNGLKEMNVLEEDFDSELHEAITKIPAPSKKLRGKVVDVIEKGYYLQDKIIRHAKVVVGE